MSHPTTLIRLKPELVGSLTTEEARTYVGGETAFNILTEQYALKPWHGRYKAGAASGRGVLWSVESIQKAMRLAEAQNNYGKADVPPSV